MQDRNDCLFFKCKKQELKLDFETEKWYVIL